MDAKVAARGREAEVIADDGCCGDEPFVPRERGVLDEDVAGGGDCGGYAVLGDDEGGEETGARKAFGEIGRGHVGEGEVDEGGVDAVGE